MALRHRIFVTVVLAAAVLAVFAAVGLSRSVERSEYDRVDARLAAELAGAVRVVDGLGRGARDRAIRLAASSEVQRALAHGDLRRLREIAAGTRGVGFERNGRNIGIAEDSGALVASAAVVSDGEAVGRVLVEVPVEAVES